MNLGLNQSCQQKNLPAWHIVRWVLMTGGVMWSGLAGAATTNTVTMQDFQYHPATLTITAGDTVIFRNDSSATHTVTGTGSDPFCGTTWLFNGDTCRRTFTDSGTNSFVCKIHPQMAGTIIVKPASTVVSITNPVNNAVFAAPATFKVQASASQLGGSIKQVAFKQGTNNPITVTNSPYQVTVTNAAASTYQFVAIATDSLNAKTTSSVVNVSVVTPVSISLSQPLVSLTNVQLSFTANTGLTYVVEGTTNLSNWVALSTNVATNSPNTVVDTKATNFSDRFYRVRRVTN